MVAFPEGTMSDVDELRACISEEALALLKKLDYPCSEELLASAVSIEDEGVVELTGSRYDFESLAGFVAGDANHEDRRRKRRLALLNEISEAFESALYASARARSW